MLSCTSEFVITDYKLQNESFSRIYANIDSYLLFSAIYVTLSWDQTLEDMSLLQSISETVWNKRLSNSIKADIAKLKELFKKTLKR